MSSIGEVHVRELAPGLTSRSRVSTRLVRAGSFVPLALVAVPWVMVTRDAWRLRSMIGGYEAIYGEARLPETIGPWPEHLQVLHDDLIAAGGGFHAGYYLLGPVVFLWLGVLWLGAIAFIDGAITGVRRWLVLAGFIAVVTDLVLFADALFTYRMITD